MQHTNQHWNTFIYLSIDDLDEEGPRQTTNNQPTNQPTVYLILYQFIMEFNWNNK